MLEPGSPEMVASVERMNAAKAEHAGNAAACLRMLDRANDIDPGGEGRYHGLVRARCEMRSGKCAAGKRRYEQVSVAHGGSSGYAKKEAARLAEVFCPPTDGKLDDRLARLRDQARSASSRGDVGQCKSLIGVAEGLRAEVTSAEQRKLLGEAFASISRGLAKKLVCDQAARARAGYFTVTAGMSAANATAAAADWVAIECKPPEPEREPLRPSRYQYIPP